MTQPGETEGFSVEDHVRKLGEYSPGLELDYVIVNSRPISPTLREKYLADGAVQVSCRSCSGHQETGWPGAVQVVRSLKLRHGIVCGDMLDENDVVRHDPDKLARIVLTLQNCGAMVAGN